MRSCLAAALAAILLSATLATTPASARAGNKPTIVLVHGAFADASGVGAVTSRLQRRGYTVIGPANPLRGPPATPRTWRASCAPSAGRSCSSATPTAAR